MSAEEFHRLPSFPKYMSIIRTSKSKPIDNPVWSSFENKENEISLNNESVSASLLTLANKLSEVVVDIEENGKIVDVTMNNKTHSIYFPHPEDDFQIAFVVVFEDNNKILIDKKAREDLMLEIVGGLRKSEKFRHKIENTADTVITREMELYSEIIHLITKIIVKWDGKRVKYLQKDLRNQREKAVRAIKEMFKAQAKQKAS